MVSYVQHSRANHETLPLRDPAGRQAGAPGTARPTPSPAGACGGSPRASPHQGHEPTHGNHPVRDSRRSASHQVCSASRGLGRLRGGRTATPTGVFGELSVERRPTISKLSEEENTTPSKHACFFHPPSRPGELRNPHRPAPRGRARPRRRGPAAGTLTAAGRTPLRRRAHCCWPCVSRPQKPAVQAHVLRTSTSHRPCGPQRKGGEPWTWSPRS